MPPPTYCPDWEPGDQLFLIRVFPELTQANLRATAMTSQCLAEGARHSKEMHAATTPLPADGDQREFDLETRVTTNGNRIISEMLHSCELNK